MKKCCFILILFISVLFFNGLSFSAETADEFLHLGNVNSKQEKFPQAILDYTKAIESNPHLEKAYYNRGYAYLEIRKYRKAFTDLNFAIELNPQYAAAYHLRGIAHFYRRKYPQAIVDYGKAIGLEPDNMIFYMSRMSAYCKIGDGDKAWKDVIKIQQLGGSVDPAIINMLKGKKYRDAQ